MEQTAIYTGKELEKIQKIELDLFKVVVKVCEELSINYFLVAGTALGAIRHNGFIPWDDDIDIGMLRKDYISFIKKAGSILPEGYYLQSPYDKFGKCPYSYAKVRRDGTKFVEFCNRNVSMHQGIYLDIFPFDEVPDNEKKNIIQFRYVQMLKKAYVIHETPDMSYKPICRNDKLKYAFRRVGHYLLSLLPKKILLNEIEKASSKYNGTGQNAIANLDYPKRKSMYMLKSTLFPLKKHVFEDLEAYIPQDCHKYLEDQYGDYMNLPPEDKRYGHKPYVIEFDDRD